MRRLASVATLLMAMGAAGCASHHPQQQTIGLIPRAERAADLRDDRVRLLGVDRAPTVPPAEPLYKVPFIVIGAGFDFVFVEPITLLYKHFSGDTPQRAADEMFDADSPDKRRHGILRLCEEPYARQSVEDRDVWARMASRDTDYSVRAAGVRALNWSRAARGELYITELEDEQPLARLEAAKALANDPDARATAPLLAHLHQDISDDVRIACADALRCYKTQEIATALIEVLDDSNFDVAWQARQSLRLMTAHDFHYDERAWLGYLSENREPFE